MKNIIIGIAGGTGSGKSTFTRKLKKEFKDDVAVLYHDNYWKYVKRRTMIIRMRWRPNF